ncbi:MAG: Veg family protein [Clostridia bacterium]|nr:Veg family protein [Clostridia bacterium]
MIKPRSDLGTVKKTIKSYYQKQVNVTVNLGRNKKTSFCGELSGVYPALFTVRPNETGYLGKTSYSYAEIMCGTVDVRLLEEENLA